MDEINILRFFETGPIEKAEVLFNILAEKMRERLRGRDQAGDGSLRESVAVKKRRSRPSAETPTGEVAEETR